jgi:dipeptidase
MECDFRISKVPAADHAEGSTRKIQRYRSQYPRYLGYDRGETYFPENTDMSIYKWAPGEGDFEPIGEIPQVKHTHGYIDGGYGIMNEYQVTIGESTCGAVLTALPVHRGGHALLEAGELSRIALERCKTAKCAVSTMGALAEKHGFYGADETKGEGGEALQVVDPNEAWVFHVLADDTGKSAVWAAQRVPEGHIAAVANQFVIRTVYLNDTTNFLGSTNILDVAERAGVWDANKNGIHVDFTQAFAMDRGHLSPVRDTFAGIFFAVFRIAPPVVFNVVHFESSFLSSSLSIPKGLT